MTLEQMRDWDHQGYGVIVLAGTSDTSMAAQANEGIQLNTVGKLETQDEINLAGKSLAQAVQGLAYSLEHRQVQRQEDLLEPEAQ
jgi:hypothetical protein